MSKVQRSIVRLSLCSKFLPGKTAFALRLSRHCPYSPEFDKYISYSDSGSLSPFLDARVLRPCLHLNSHVLRFVEKN